jgi:uncharacterized damage-inducible protein DinB
MHDDLGMWARYSERANRSVAALLDGLSLEERNKDRGAYYGSLAGLLSHVLGGTLYFQGLFRASRPGYFAACESISSLSSHEGAVDAAGWEALKRSLAAADKAAVELSESLSPADADWPVPLDWYGGNPKAVPLRFLFNQMIVHGIHHRGQISQVLDEMKVEHDFSGIDLEFLE